MSDRRDAAGPPARPLRKLRDWEIGLAMFCVAASLTEVIALATDEGQLAPWTRWWTVVLLVVFAVLPVVVGLGWRVFWIVASDLWGSRRQPAGE
ncbi:hypothetical protein [Kribbella lupini]|uniref:Phospholipase D-like protein n=1 Tax=Kribbella lupini TaxID=291602 RepID=A0ABN2AIN1_9ACTN